MSNRELAKNLIDKIPDSKINYAISFLSGFQLDDEIEDDLYCQRLVDGYLNDPSPDKDETVPIEELAKRLGVELS